MKGTVVLRYVGNRQEPEEKPVDSSALVWLEECESLRKEMEAWVHHVQRIMAASFNVKDKLE